MAKGRIKLEIDKVQFQKVVTDLESTQVFVNPSHLWKAVEDTEWAKSLKPRALTASVAYARAKEFNIISKTPKGKKGAGNPNLGKLPKGPRVPRSEKMKKFASTYDVMRTEVSTQYHPLIKKAEGGSIRAAIKLKCLDCCAWEMKEVKECVCTGCSLFPFRPGANKKVDANEDSE